MKKATQRVLVLIGLLDIVTAVIVASHFMDWEDVILKVIPTMIAFNFFMYKLLAGWLIVNMTVTVEPSREPIDGDTANDHLALKVTLNKGSIDSVWLEKIEIRVRHIPAGSSADQWVSLLNSEKLGDEDMDYWNGRKSKFYTISSGEEASFSGYTTVPSNAVISAELLVLGTRLFYGIESGRDKRIQWRSSAVILPITSKNQSVI